MRTIQEETSQEEKKEGKIIRICPCCGYRDPDCWRQPYSRGMEVDHARIEDVEVLQPEIARALKEATPNKRGVHQWQDNLYAYGLWPSG